MGKFASPRAWLAAAWSLFQLYTAQAGLYDLLIQLPVHVAFAVALGFLTAPVPDSPEAAERLRTVGQPRWRRLSDGLCALLALACALHYIVHNERLASRMAMVDDPRTLDVVVGVLFTLLLLEASRRHIGGALVVLALAFIGYAFVGPWMPGFLKHGGEAFLKVVDHGHAAGQPLVVHDVVQRARQRQQRADAVGPASPARLSAGPQALGRLRRVGDRRGEESQRHRERDVDGKLDQEIVEPGLRRVELEQRPCGGQPGARRREFTHVRERSRRRPS